MLLRNMTIFHLMAPYIYIYYFPMKLDKNFKNFIDNFTVAKKVRQVAWREQKTDNLCH